MAEQQKNRFQIKNEEQHQVLLMLCIGFFMGVFISTYQVTADSLFLNRLGEYLDKAFLLAGALGIMTTALFTYFQNRIQFTSLVLVSCVLIFGFTMGVYLLLHLGDPTWERLLLFTMYCMTGPITAVLLLSYWGIFGRLFNFRQSKRIIGWIDTGQLIAAIVATFSIPFTDRFIPDTSSYLLVCSASMLLMFVLMLIISWRFTLVKNDPREFGATIRQQTTVGKLFKDPYILLMSSFLLVSMITFVFGQYAFQEIARDQYPSERELTNFNAFFTGSVYGLSLLMQTFVNQRIISNYGLRISLFLLPLVVGIFSIASFVTGGVFGFDKTSSPTGFLYFFLFMSLGRLFNWTFRDSLENPVFKLFFIPLNSRLRFNIQTKVEGLVNEGARFFAGLLIFIFGLLSFFQIIYIPAIILVLLGIYFFVVNKLYSGYRSKIRAKLEEPEEEEGKLEGGVGQVMQTLETMLSDASASRAVFSFKLLEKVNAANVPSWINKLMKHDDEMIRQYAQEKLNELKGLSVSDRYVIRQDESRLNGSMRNVLSHADLQQFIESEGDFTINRIRRLVRSSYVDDRQYAAEMLLHTSYEECNAYLIELLYDGDSKVRNTAIKTSVKKHNPEIIYALIDNLGTALYSNQAMNALVQIGADTLAGLESAFYRSGQATPVMLKIVQVMGRIGGPKVNELLWNKTDYPNKLVISQVLLSLGTCGFKAGVTQVTRIKHAIEADIADIRWNLSALQEIGYEGFAGKVKESILWEIQNDIEHIYMLLAMLYDTRSIQLVKENIDSGTTEGITYAIELLDVFLSDHLKRRVIPVLDDLTDNERINRLDAFYPRIRLDTKLVLKFMINRDYTQTNRWTKASALFYIGMQRMLDFQMDLVAQLFNPDALLREISAWALYQIDPSLYSQHVRRLPLRRKREMDDCIIHGRRMSVFEKVLFFQRIAIFQAIPMITLSRLADISTELRVEKGAFIPLGDDSSNVFYIVVKGSAQAFRGESLLMTFSEGQFIGELLSISNFINANVVIANTDLTVLRFDKDLFYELLADNITLSDKLLTYV